MFWVAVVLSANLCIRIWLGKYFRKRDQAKVQVQDIAQAVVEQLYASSEPVSFLEMCRRIGENPSLLRRSLRYLHSIRAIEPSSGTGDPAFYPDGSHIRLTPKGRWAVYKELS